MSRGWTYIDPSDEQELSPQNLARADALANMWNDLHDEDEQRSFDRQERAYESGPELECSCPGSSPCEDLDDCPTIAGQLQAVEQEDLVYRQARRKQYEFIHQSLEALSLRMMRPYEHWNEDERYMEMAESGNYSSML